MTPEEIAAAADRLADAHDLGYRLMHDEEARTALAIAEAFRGFAMELRSTETKGDDQ